MSEIQRIFTVDVTVDHEDRRDVVNQFDLPPGYKITNFTGPEIESISGPSYQNYARVEGNTFVVSWHVEGKGVRRVNIPFVGSQVVDYLGRGWVRAHYKVFGYN